MIAIAVFSTCFNLWGAKLLPLYEGVALLFNLIGFFAVMVPLWALAPKVSASKVFLEFSNYGGWSSLGSAAVIGQIAASGAMVGADSAAHMSEEVRDNWLLLAGTTVLNSMLAGQQCVAHSPTYDDGHDHFERCDGICLDSHLLFRYSRCGNTDRSLDGRVLLHSGL